MSEENKVNVINDDTLEGVSGGLIFNASNIAGADPNNPFEVLDDSNGQVLARANSYDQARRYAERMGKSTEYTEDWSRIQRLRGGK